MILFTLNILDQLSSWDPTLWKLFKIDQKISIPKCSVEETQANLRKLEKVEEIMILQEFCMLYNGNTRILFQFELKSQTKTMLWFIIMFLNQYDFGKFSSVSKIPRIQAFGCSVKTPCLIINRNTHRLLS